MGVERFPVYRRLLEKLRRLELGSVFLMPLRGRLDEEDYARQGEGKKLSCLAACTGVAIRPSTSGGPMRTKFIVYHSI